MERKTRRDKSKETSTRELPSARECFQEIAERVAGKRVAVFLDYDGTLTPIVDRPDQARLSEEMRNAIRALMRHASVAVISGRDLPDVRNLVSVDGIFYAGSHGFDIAGPEGQQHAFPEGSRFLPVLDRAEQELRERMDQIPGVLLERKRFSIAIHYRGAEDAVIPDIEASVDDVLSRHSELRKTSGKKIFDLQPRVDWHKGKALHWLLNALDLDRSDVVPFYIGDDTTDENAFTSLENRGVSIVVRDEARQTGADYALENPGDVKTFLDELAKLLDKGSTRAGGQESR